MAAHKDFGPPCTKMYSMAAVHTYRYRVNTTYVHERVNTNRRCACVLNNMHIRAIYIYISVYTRFKRNLFEEDVCARTPHNEGSVAKKKQTRTCAYTTMYTYTYALYIPMPPQTHIMRIIREYTENQIDEAFPVRPPNRARTHTRTHSHARRVLYTCAQQ